MNNILFDNITQRPKAIIDLDTIMPGLLPYDFGDMVRTYTPPEDENSNNLGNIYVRTAVWKALTEGYLDGIKEAIHPVERNNLNNGAELIIYEQALRFLGDFLQGDPYYITEYDTQNLVRAKNQLTLLKDFSKKMNDL